MTTQISASMVKELREKTGAGMMDAKNALVEAQGDMEKAAELLRQKGVVTAEKKSGRAAAEGVISAKVSANGKEGVLLELNCETDFVARGEAFQTLVQQITDQALSSKATGAEALLQEKSAAEPDKTVEELIKDRIGVIKENINLRRLTRYALTTPGWIQSYIHIGSKIGVLLELQTGAENPAHAEALKELAKDLTLHIASVSPEYVHREEIPASVIEEEKRIEMGKEDLQKKPPEIREKIVSGRIDKLLAQRVFLEQPFVKNPEKTIAELLKDKSTELGTPISVTRFTRYLLGEGVEKKQDNFAEEVMAQIKH